MHKTRQEKPVTRKTHVLVVNWHGRMKEWQREIESER